jgi:inorganic triphosphatase YgiF
MKTELEAKLLVPDDATLEALARLERLGDLVLRRPRAVRQHDTYVDTATLRLHRAGYGCRIRRRGRRARVTLKGLGSVQGALHEREEWEHRLPAPTAEAVVGLEAEPGPRLRDLAAGEPLGVLFTIETHRRTWEAACGDRVCFELALDSSRFHVPSGEQVLREVELESRDGDAQLLTEAAAELRERFGLEDSTLSKFARGLRWAGRLPRDA